MAKTNHTRSIDVGKVCSKCGEFKSPSDYYTVKNRQGKPKLESACKKCANSKRAVRMRIQKGLDPTNGKTWKEEFGNEYGFKPCSVCGVNIWGEDKLRRNKCAVCFAKEECGKIAIADANVRPLVLIKDLECTECGDRVTRATRSSIVFCSKQCRFRHNRRNRRARDRLAYVEPVSLFEIATRDKWTCGLCGKKVRKDAPFKRQATLDHVVPITKGGTHERCNVQLAHFDCNAIKHNKVLTLF